jgi:serine/threonine-protein kinase HipA
LWIAKFPSRTDTHDKGAWEYLVHTLASQCGLHVPVARLLKTGRKHHIFLSKRFDRVTGGGRLHFSSALNLAGLADGTGAVSGAGYFDILEIILRHSSSPVEDAREIWMRLIFGLCTGNTDDHLRNHGFLLDGANSKGWRLSPAFDINPDPDGDTLALNILPDDNRMDLDIALSVCDHFRLKLEDAKAQMTRIQSVVSTWRKVAKRLRLPRQEQEAMAHAFRLSEDSQ